MREAIADGGFDQPAKYHAEGGSLRRILIDMIDEYSRHVGHADLMREAAAGLAGEDPPQS